MEGWGGGLLPGGLYGRASSSCPSKALSRSPVHSFARTAALSIPLCHSPLFTNAQNLQASQLNRPKNCRVQGFSVPYIYTETLHPTNSTGQVSSDRSHRQPALKIVMRQSSRILVLESCEGTIAVHLHLDWLANALVLWGAPVDCVDADVPGSAQRRHLELSQPRQVDRIGWVGWKHALRQFLQRRISCQLLHTARVVSPALYLPLSHACAGLHPCSANLWSYRKPFDAVIRVSVKGFLCRV